MIYTVTFNPSLDYIVSVNNFEIGTVNRTISEKILAGGKGINVSTVLQNLGHDNTALGFVAGFTGEEIKRLLTEKKVKSDFVSIDEGISRINVKLRSDTESEINGEGPNIKENDINQLYEKLDKLVENDILVLAGSIPGVIPDTIYMDIMEKMQKKNLKVVVDATKDLLINVLKFKPFLIKPNNHELGDMFGIILKNKNDVIEYAKKLQDKGAQNVLVSMAGEGAVLIADNGSVFVCDAPKGKLKNSVGAGDSMVAGFIAGYIETNNYKEAFKMGVSTGSASAFSEELATKEEVLNILNTHQFIF